MRRAIAQHAAAATVVQKCWRGRMQRRRYLRMRSAAVRLQAAVRRRQLRRSFFQARSAAVIVQVHLPSLHNSTSGGLFLSAWPIPFCICYLLSQAAEVYMAPR